MSEILDQLRKRLLDCPESYRKIGGDAGVEHSQLSRFAAGESGLGLSSIEALADYFELRLTLQPKRRRKGRNP